MGDSKRSRRKSAQGGRRGAGGRIRVFPCRRGGKTRWACLGSQFSPLLPKRRRRTVGVFGDLPFCCFFGLLFPAAYRGLLEKGSSRLLAERLLLLLLAPSYQISSPHSSSLLTTLPASLAATGTLPADCPREASHASFGRIFWGEG